MGENILIIGSSRTGKTTLSNRISDELGYNIIPMDPIVHSFQDVYPDLDISHKDISTNSRDNIDLFMINYFINLDRNVKDDKYKRFIMEGWFMNLESAVNVTSLTGSKLIFLANNFSNTEEIYEYLRKYDEKNDWSYYLNNETLKEFCKILHRDNLEIINFCDAHNYEYFDLSNHREEKIKKIVLSLK